MRDGQVKQAHRGRKLSTSSSTAYRNHCACEHSVQHDNRSEGRDLMSWATDSASINEAVVQFAAPNGEEMWGTSAVGFAEGTRLIAAVRTRGHDMAHTPFANISCKGRCVKTVVARNCQLVKKYLFYC